MVSTCWPSPVVLRADLRDRMPIVQLNKSQKCSSARVVYFNRIWRDIRSGAVGGDGDDHENDDNEYDDQEDGDDD
eukprot:12427082-Karenia_brevis.AAC.1